MRLRRLEFAIIAITLAFGFFIGGFFTGRNHRVMNITAMGAQSQESLEKQGSSGSQVSISQPMAEKQNSGVLQDQNIENAGTANNSETTDTINAKPQSKSEATDTIEILPDNSLTGQGTGAPRNSDGKININSATHGELTDLPGIGNTLATRIIDYRNQNGVFTKIEDIRKVSGIGEKRFEAIADLITVG